MRLHLLLIMIFASPLHTMQFHVSGNQFDTASTARLFGLILEGNVEEIRNIITQNNADPNAIICEVTNDITRQQKSSTILEHILFLRYKHPHEFPIVIIETLIKCGADINKQNYRDKLHFAPLHTAVKLFDQDAVTLLLQHNADIYKQSTEGYPLHILCRSNAQSIISPILNFPPEKGIEVQKNIARALLQAGALINPETQRPAFLPLRLAVKYGNHFLIPLLVKYGANLKQGNLLTAASSNKNPLKSIQTIRMLLEYGLNPYQQDGNGYNFREKAATYQMIKKEYQDWRKKNKETFDRQTAFLETAQAGELKDIKILSDVSFIKKLPALPLEVIEQIFDLMNMPWTGRNFLDIHQKKFIKQSLKELATKQEQLSDEILQQKVASYCAKKFPGRNILGRPPMHWVLKQTHDVRVLKQFVKEGMQKDEKDADGNTLLHTAVIIFDTIKPTLIEYLKDMLNSGDDCGVTPLGASFFNKNKNCDTQIALIKAGANIHAKTKNGETILHFAAIDGNPHKIQFCLDQGLPIDIRDNASNTPLHDYLCYNNASADTTTAFDIFFRASAPLDAQNLDNESCINIAHKRGIDLVALYKEWHVRTKPSLKDTAKKKLKKLKHTLSLKKKE